MRCVWGLLIRGLSVSGSAEPTLFVDGDLDASTLPSPLSTSSQIKGWLVPDSLSGARANLDLRNPLISATAPTIQLQDDATGTLAALLEGDPGYLNTSRWTLDSTVSLTAAATSLVVTGPTDIAVGDELYLNGEALTVTVRALTHSGQVKVQTLTVTRGACGSDAKAHAVDPSTYAPGTDGSQACLTLYSRPQFENGLFEAQIFQFQMSDTNPAAVSSILYAWFGTVEARPTPDADFRWTVAVTHASKALAEFVVPGAKDLELSHCIGVVATSGVSFTQGVLGMGGITRTLPSVVQFNFTRSEFEALFNEPAHLSQSVQFDSSLITTLSSRLTPNGKVKREIVGEVDGYRYVWNLRSLTYDGAGHPRRPRPVGQLHSLSCLLPAHLPERLPPGRWVQPRLHQAQRLSLGDDAPVRPGEDGDGRGRAEGNGPLECAHDLPRSAPLREHLRPWRHEQRRL
jgi:hypothetical protein